MGASLSRPQQEARRTGMETGAIQYLNKHPLIAVAIFSLATAVSALWLEALINIVAQYVFHKPRDQLAPWMWVVVAGGLTGVLFLLLRYVVPVPLTAAFSL